MQTLYRDERPSMTKTWAPQQPAQSWQIHSDCRWLTCIGPKLHQCKFLRWYCAQWQSYPSLRRTSHWHSWLWHLRPLAGPTSNLQCPGQGYAFRDLKSAISGQGWGHFEAPKSAIFWTDIWGSFRGPQKGLDHWHIDYQPIFPQLFECDWNWMSDIEFTGRRSQACLGPVATSKWKFSAHLLWCNLNTTNFVKTVSHPQI